MEPPIIEKLAALEAEHGFRILFAAEAGSRAWGFASADSDYDVRFVYVWPSERYLDIKPVEETVDHEIDEHEIDLSGWELRKALRLFRKSNGALIEWIFSSITYREDVDLTRVWRKMIMDDGLFVPGRSAAHYLGLARGMAQRLDNQPEKVTAKRYLYLMRSLLAARYVVDQEKPPPVLFSELIDRVSPSGALREALEAMIAAKSTGSESDQIGRLAVLDEVISSMIPALEEAVDALSKEEVPDAPLDQYFRSVLDHYAVS